MHKTNLFNPYRIFVDTNVLIGGYSGDARFQKDSACLHYLYSLSGRRLFILSLSIAQLVSVYQKKKTNEEIANLVREIQHRFTVIDFTNRDVDAALVETGADIEDNIQYVVAMKQKCSIIITNNFKDYRLFQNIHAIRPERVRAIPQ